MQAPNTTIKKAEHTFINPNIAEEETGDPWSLLASQSRQISELQVLVRDPASKKDGGEGLEKAPDVSLWHPYTCTLHKHYTHPHHGTRYSSVRVRS